MKALILNSGMGTRMGVLTSEQPKCMTEVSNKETILSRQLNMLVKAGINKAVITTGYLDGVLVNYCKSLAYPLDIVFVKNPEFENTNYIYSIYCAREYLNDDIIMFHGDMVFESSVLDDILESEYSCMAVSSTVELPKKDFKAVIKNGKIHSVGVEFFGDSLAAQPFYKLHKDEWKIWLNSIISYCQSGNRKCYAESAFNEVSDRCQIYPLDVEGRLCNEIDNTEDLAVVSSRLHEIENRTVYMCFSTDMLHGGHISIIKKAQKLGKLIIGVMSDEAVVSYKRYPLISFEDRKAVFESMAGVYKVVEQSSLHYKANLEHFKPDYVVHGDDWRTGFQKSIRDEVVEVLASYGGKLVEYPYSGDVKYRILEEKRGVKADYGADSSCGFKRL